MVEREPRILGPDAPEGDSLPGDVSAPRLSEPLPETPSESPPSQPDGDGGASSVPATAKSGGRRAQTARGPTFYVGGFWRRLAAAVIDLAIVVPTALVLCWVAGKVAGVHLPPSRHRSIDFWLDLLLANDPALLGGIGLTLAIAVVYAQVFQLTMSRTLGMRALKLRIIDVYGDELSTARAALRTLGYLASLATLGLGFLWIGFDSEKRGLHDWISSTYVVKS